MKNIILVLCVQVAMYAAVIDRGTIGHEYRQDDSPQVTADAGNRVWVF